MKLLAVTPVTPVPGVEPKTTVGVPVKLEPLTVTVLPPAWGPLFGLTEVTVGGRVVGELVTRCGRRGAVRAW